MSIASWYCTVCGYVHRGEVPPEYCPVCGVAGERFEPAADELQVREKGLSQ
ncbi:MAG: rubredoxin-type Fe(Cys)4 protein, partial [Deltaproteobacteria bacterium]|nr:rubredoxin-type Fe(Cys)4 protein [Deltaproteobacteria bacterium]